MKMLLYVILLLLAQYLMPQQAIALKTTDGIEFLGRFYVSPATASQPPTYSADWPSAGIRFSVVAKESRVNISLSFLRASSVSFLYYVGLFVDGKQVHKYEINPHRLHIDFAYNATPDQVNVIMMRKLTEASFLEARGNMTLGDVEVKGGSILPTATSAGTRKRRLFVIGDSITCGYGVEGHNARCGFSAATEDVSQAYAFLLAKALDLDVDVICWSGLGVVRNYGDTKPLSDLPMTALYNRTLATVAPSAEQNSNGQGLLWHPSQQPTDLVIIALGTNDYSTAPTPPDDQFIQTYVNLVHQVRKDHPGAKVLATCEPMTRGRQCHNIQQAAKQSQVPYFEIPPRTLSGGKGCHFHPNRKSQQNIADALLPVVKTLL